MLGGGNYDVQTTILADLTDRSKTGRELLGSSCRRIMREASDELRSLRKKKHSGRGNDILLVASHTLNVLCSSCANQHIGMQEYIPQQTGHEETFLLVPDIYEFTVEVEREVKYAIENGKTDALIHEAADETSGAHSHSKLTRSGLSVNLVDVFEMAFRLFSNLCTGPHEQNQGTVAASSILLVINRVHSYCGIVDSSELKALNVTDPSPSWTELHWQDPSLIKCRLNSYCKELILALLEGTADNVVMNAICQSIDFSVWSQHMRTMKNISDGLTDSKLKLPSRIQKSAWVRAECFAFITILEKLVASDLPRKSMLPLMPVLRQKPMMEWYRARLGQVEVVRKGQLEPLYFEMPVRWLEPAAYADLVDETTILLDDAFSSAESQEDRVSAFVENVIEYIWAIDRNQRDMTLLAKHMLFFLRFATGAWYQLILSLAINIVCLLALGTANDETPPEVLTENDGSLADEAFGMGSLLSMADKFQFNPGNPKGIVYERYESGASWIYYLAPLHFLISILAVAQFLMVRNPILSNVSSREKMLRRMRRLRHSKQAVGSGFEDFVVCTVHVKDLPAPRTAWNPEGFTATKLKSVLEVYGEIGGITMWGTNSQQALVSFLQEDVVDRVCDTLVDLDVREWTKQLTMTGGLSSVSNMAKAMASTAENVTQQGLDLTQGLTSSVGASARMVGAGSSRMMGTSARMPTLGNSRLVGNMSLLAKEISESAESSVKHKTQQLREEAAQGLAAAATAANEIGERTGHVTGSPFGHGISEMGGTMGNLIGETSEWFKNSSPKDIQYRHLTIGKISLEQATRSSGEFSEKLKSAAREYSEGTSENSSRSMKTQVKAVIGQATNLNMAVANVIALLTYDITEREASSFISTTSSDSLISLKLGPQFLRVLVDLVFSACGYGVHPLFFAYHLNHLFSARAATIVLKSITTNLSRLTTTLILALLVMYFFAIAGYLFFSDKHTNEMTGNPGGPCSNLLTCFVSYTFAGFLQQGLVYWLQRPNFPEGVIETSADILGEDGGRIIFEIAFMLVMSAVVVAIITGIIVDTFGELRMAQDVAARYRRSTCFITGIPFTQVPEHKKTSHLQYVFLLFFLRRKKLAGVRPLTPLERVVADKVDVGDISWMPLGRDASIDDDIPSTDDLATIHTKRSGQQRSSRQMAGFESQLSTINEALERIESVSWAPFRPIGPSAAS